MVALSYDDKKKFKDRLEHAFNLRLFIIYANFIIKNHVLQ